MSPSSQDHGQALAPDASQGLGPEPAAPAVDGVCADRVAGSGWALAWFFSSTALTACALAASGALLVDYLGKAPVFCAASGGCGTVRQSALAFIGPVPLPAIGAAGLLAIGVATVARGRRARAVNFALALAASVVAMLLISVQVWLGVFCTYCMTVDGICLVLPVLAAARLRRAFDRPAAVGYVAAPVAAFALALAAPWAVGPRLATPPPQALPEEVLAELAATPAAQVCVVEYVDYECPHCRRTHADFAPILTEHEGAIRVVRKNVPLVTMHPHAMTAARAATCGAAMGKGDAMSAGLFAVPVDELTEAGCEALAARLGLDAAGYRACMDDPANARRIDAEREAFSSQGGRGLPTIWVDRIKIEGARGPAALRSAVAVALSARAPGRAQAKP